MHLRNKLATTRKGDLSCAAFFTKITGFVDDLAVAGKKVEDEDVISYILAGLDGTFNPFIENVCRRLAHPSLGDFYAQIRTAESRTEAQRQEQHIIVANMANCGRGHGGGSYEGRNRGGRDAGCCGRGCCNSNSRSRPVCQHCKHTCHTVVRCYKRFDASFNGEEEDKLAGAVSAYDIDRLVRRFWDH